MKKNSRKKKGFTLIEIIISLCVIAIISIGVYGAYTLIIRTIKDGEEKQIAAIVGKQTIESIKGSSDGIKCNDGKIFFDGIEFDASKMENGFTFSKKDISLDSQYKQTTDSGDSRYTETISIEKATAADEDNKSVDISLDSKINNANKDEKGKDIEEVKDTNIIKCNLNMIRKSGNSFIQYVNGDGHIEGESGAIPLNYKDKVSIDIYIEPSGNKKKITVKDCKGNNLLSQIITEDKTENEKINRLEVCLNFSNYKKTAGEEIKKVEVNIFNKDVTNDDNYAAVILEKNTELDVKCEPREGKITFYNNRNGSDETTKLGTLYNITVEITRNKDGETLFTGYSNENLIFDE